MLKDIAIGAGLAWLLFFGATQGRDRVEILPSTFSVELEAKSDGEIAVLVKNVATPCFPFFIDRVFASREWGGRPFTLLTFEVLDGEGNRVQMLPPPHRSVSGLQAQDLVLLDCSTAFVRYIDLRQSEWTFPLRTGRYFVRARVEIRLRSYFDRNPALRDQLLPHDASSRNRALMRVIDHSLVSNQVEIQIRPAPPARHRG